MGKVIPTPPACIDVQTMNEMLRQTAKDEWLEDFDEQERKDIFERVSSVYSTAQRVVPRN